MSDYTPSLAKYEFNWMAEEPRMNIPVLSQGHCQSCWAITSSTAAGYLYYLERAKEEGDDFRLSAQELMDRVLYYYDGYRAKDKDGQGCYRATIPIGYQYIMDHGVNLEENYPYRGKFCDKGLIGPHERPRIKFTKFKKLKEHEIVSALKERSLAGTIEVTKSLMSYNGEGVCEKGGNVRGKHAIVIVGVNEIENYYVIRNSRGRDWGRGGYACVRRNMVTKVSYPMLPVEKLE